jgi:hypothetical protein
MSVRLGEHGVDRAVAVSVVEARDHVADERRMQPRDVDGREVDGLGAAVEGREARQQAGQRSSALDRVVRHLDPGRQRRQLLPRRADDHDRAVDGAGHEARHPAHERRAVPRQEGLGRTHARRSAARQDDACTALHPASVAVAGCPFG